MNAAEFNTELGKLIDRAVKEGLAPGKMSPIEVVGIMECVKADVVRNLQDMARQAAAQQQPRLYLPPK